MGGKWALYTEQSRGYMSAIPGKSGLFGMPEQVDMSALSERLEQQWQAEEDARAC